MLELFCTNNASKYLATLDKLVRKSSEDINFNILNGENKMEYQVKSQKLQDVMSKTVRLTAPAQSLGSVASNVLTIPLADISADAIEASDVLVANNLSEDTAATPAISGSNLTLTDVSLAASDIIDLVIKLK